MAWKYTKNRVGKLKDACKNQKIHVENCAQWEYSSFLLELVLFTKYYFLDLLLDFLPSNKGSKSYSEHKEDNEKREQPKSLTLWMFFMMQKIIWLQKVFLL